MVGGSQLENANPLIYQRSGERRVTAQDEDEELHDKIDDREIFDILSVTAGGRQPRTAGGARSYVLLTWTEFTWWGGGGVLHSSAITLGPVTGKVFIWLHYHLEVGVIY